jgi:formylglycine-generating enzyme required for sulfatase activity
MKKQLVLLIFLISGSLQAQHDLPEDLLKPKIEQKQKQTVQPVTPAKQGIYLKVITTLDCEVFIDGESKGKILAGEENMKKIPLKKGEFMIVAKSLDGLDKKTERIIMEGEDKYHDIDLKAVRDSRLVKEEAAAGEMVSVAGGTFTMGCTSEQSECSDDESPTHSVTLSSYSIGKYEVTQAQWQAVMGNNPSHFSGCANCPVEQVSWDDIHKDSSAN